MVVNRYGLHQPTGIGYLRYGSAEDQFIELVIREHPTTDRPKKLDVLPDEIKGLKSAGEIVVIEVGATVTRSSWLSAWRTSASWSATKWSRTLRAHAASVLAGVPMDNYED